mgnify:CR=1 FL=1
MTHQSHRKTAAAAKPYARRNQSCGSQRHGEPCRHNAFHGNNPTRWEPVQAPQLRLLRDAHSQETTQQPEQWLLALWLAQEAPLQLWYLAPWWILLGELRKRNGCVTLISFLGWRSAILAATLRGDDGRGMRECGALSRHLATTGASAMKTHREDTILLRKVAALMYELSSWLARRERNALAWKCDHGRD